MANHKNNSSSILLLPFLSFILCVSFTASAYSPFYSTIASVVDTNGEILASQKQIEATLASDAAANVLPSAEVEFEYLWATSGWGDNKWNLGVSQELQLPSLFKARTAASEAQAEASHLILLGMKAEKALAAKQAIIDVINATVRLNYYKEVGENLANIQALVQKSYSQRGITILDLKKIEIALLDNEKKIAEYESEIMSLKASLRGMGAILPESNVVWNDYPAQICAAPDSVSDGLLYAIQAAQDAATASKKRAVKLEQMPSLSIGYRHAFEEGGHFDGISLGITLPSYGMKKAKQTASFEREAAMYEAEARIRNEVAENQGLYESAMATQEVMEKYRMLTSDNTYLTLLKKAYEGGEIRIIDYITEVNLFTESRLSYLDLQYSKAITLARLNRYRSLDF